MDDDDEVKKEYNISLVNNIGQCYDAVILAVSHNEFLDIDFKKLKNGHDAVIFDTKSFIKRELVDSRL